MTHRNPNVTPPHTRLDAWRRAVVYGLGVSGRAAVRVLQARGIDVVAVDGRNERAMVADDLRALRATNVRLVLGREPGDDEVPSLLDGVDAVITSPGVPAERPLLAAARAEGVPVLAEVELAYRHLETLGDAGHDDGAARHRRETENPVIGITGSNGKSTTTAMTGALLRAAGVAAVPCGNLGPPFADAVADAAGSARSYVVELSSFQLETIDRFRPRAAALLNLSPDHIDRHGSFAAYRDAKAALFRNQRRDDIAVLNADDTAVASVAVPGRRRMFSRRGPVQDGCYLDRDRVVEVAPGMTSSELFAVDDLPVEGVHNLENAMAAALLARSQSASPSAIRAGLRSFRGLPHRLEHVTTREGVRWLDDSKGTNVGATLASLEGFVDGTVHIILGGRAKDADFAPLVPITARKARRVYLIGESADLLADTLAGAETPIDLVHAETLDRAVSLAAASAVAGEVVLLSPACASFDQFDGFDQRGRVFQRLVGALDDGDVAMHAGEGGDGA